MSAEIYRKYIDIINENSQAKVQLDEGVMDMLSPYIKKAANALMSKFDPATLKGLSQAYKQSGGDKNKFMSMIGIAPQDLAPLAKGGVKEAQFDHDSAAGVVFGSGSDLKSKVLTGLMNVLPLVGVLDMLFSGPIGTALANAGGDILKYVFYIASSALIWGIGHYDFGADDSNPPVGFTGRD